MSCLLNRRRYETLISCLDGGAAATMMMMMIAQRCALSELKVAPKQLLPIPSLLVTG